MKIDDYKSWLALSYDEFVAENKLRITKVEENVVYEKITGATRVCLSDNEFFFFRQGKPQVIYISNEDLTDRLWREFRRSIDTKTPEETLRSRAGKTSNQLVFASWGFTASVKGDRVDFIEIYSPCSVQDYLDDIYREPGLFIR